MRQNSPFLLPFLSACFLNSLTSKNNSTGSEKLRYIHDFVFVSNDCKIFIHLTMLQDLILDNIYPLLQEL